ncbi:MAG: itaconyl-CoA hydratase, partial [Chloroflexota bacterium]|nr:itaconyl-CoA hydratase [Chloroflexota bacterium]
MATPDARAAISGWSFDDARPGLTIEHPGGRTIGTDEHAWLAMVTNNASDLHGNVEYARTTEFGQPVVLGALAVAIVVGLGQPVEWPPADAARCQPAGWTRIRLTRAVSPGDTLRAVSTIVSVVPRRD